VAAEEAEGGQAHRNRLRPAPRPTHDEEESFAWPLKLVQGQAVLEGREAHEVPSELQAA
jgi:hypothetical protein